MFRPGQAKGPSVASAAGSGSGLGPLVTLTVVAGHVTPDFTTSNNFFVTLTSDVILDNPPNHNQQSFYIRFKQGGAGGFKVSTYGTDYRFADSLPEPVFSTDVNKEDMFCYSYNDHDSLWDLDGEVIGYPYTDSGDSPSGPFYEPVYSRVVVIPSFESSESVTTGDGTLFFNIPTALDGHTLLGVCVSVYAKGVTGTTTVQVRKSSAGADSDMLSVPVTLGNVFYSENGTVNPANDTVAVGDMLFADIDTVHSGTAPLGLSVALTFAKVTP